MPVKDELKFLPLNQVRPNEVALRKVKKETERYLELVDSVRVAGILNPVLVREMKDPSGAKYWGLIDGLHRYSASIDAGKETIPAHIKSADEATTLEYQIIGNIHNVATLPSEFSEQLHYLLGLNPTMTELTLAEKLGKSVTWVKDRLGIAKLKENIQELADDNTINITNASQLSKIPAEEQENFLQQAMTMPPNQFIPVVSARLKEIKDAKKQGRAPGGVKTFNPVPFMQKLATIKDELKNLYNCKGLLNTYGISDPIDACMMTLKWVLHIDPISAEIQRQEDEERKTLAKIEKEKKKEEREMKKKQDAALVAVGASANSDPEEIDFSDEEE